MKLAQNAKWRSLLCVRNNDFRVNRSEPPLAECWDAPFMKLHAEGEKKN